MRLQDAISGPERPELNSGFSRGRAPRHRHKLGYSAAPWLGAALDISPKLSSPYAQATLSSPQNYRPRERERRAALAPSSLSRGTSLSIAHRSAVDAAPSNKDKGRCKPARKLGPP